MTSQSGRQIAMDLVLTSMERQIKGDSFTLTLLVAIPFSSQEERPYDIIVDRVDKRDEESSTHSLANGDRIIATTARLEPSGESFNISLLFRLEQMHDNGAEVFVSEDMERIILDMLARAVDQPLDEDTQE